MTKNVNNIKVIITNWTGFRTEQVLLFGQLTEVKEKLNLSYIFEFQFDSRFKQILFCPILKQSFTKPESDFFSTHKIIS